MLQDAFDSLADIASPPFRKVVVKSLALTAAALLVAWFGLDRLALHFVDVQPSWLATLIAWLIGLSLLVGAVFLAAPVASLVASLFFDEIAAHVEAQVDPLGAPGRPAPFVEATLAALRFAGLSLAVGIVSLILLFVPGIGFAAWLAANAYLLGREYFELAAMRFHSAAQARALRRQRAGIVFAYGVMIAVFVAIPLVNLLTPLFATTLMVRLHKRVARAG
ncbi:MAG: sulfate transporter family protein [Roseiarcus sp.]|uniref:sulfate transporter family protein n=1 Tax=Roseiarcus sp. TaxID=1969460 RepID=UPI003C1902F3